MHAERGDVGGGEIPRKQVAEEAGEEGVEAEDLQATAVSGRQRAPVDEEAALVQAFEKLRCGGAAAEGRGFLQCDVRQLGHPRQAAAQRRRDAREDLRHEEAEERLAVRVGAEGRCFGAVDRALDHEGEPREPALGFLEQRGGAVGVVQAPGARQRDGVRLRQQQGVRADDAEGPVRDGASERIRRLGARQAQEADVRRQRVEQDGEDRREAPDVVGGVAVVEHDHGTLGKPAEPGPEEGPRERFECRELLCVGLGQPLGAAGRGEAEIVEGPRGIVVGRVDLQPRAGVRRCAQRIEPEVGERRLAGPRRTPEPERAGAVIGEHRKGLLAPDEVRRMGAGDLGGTLRHGDSLDGVRVRNGRSHCIDGGL